MTKLLRCLIIFLLFASICYSQDLIVGVIEQNFDDWKIDTVNPFVVRVAFKKEADGWKSYPTDFSPPDECRSFYPAKLSWHICFDGRDLGSISSSIPETIDSYMHIGIHYIKDLKKIPKIGAPSLDFSGWLHEPVYRPLVVCTLPYCTDSIRWKPYKPRPEDISVILGHVDTTVIKTVYPIRPGMYEIHKSYASKYEKLVCLSFISQSVAAGDTLVESTDDSDNNLRAWFLLRDTSCRYLRSNMLLLDAGDYDNDSNVEVVFKFEEYDHDGYILFYSDFRKMVQFGWIYH